MPTPMTGHSSERKRACQLSGSSSDRFVLLRAVNLNRDPETRPVGGLDDAGEHERRGPLLEPFEQDADVPDQPAVEAAGMDVRLIVHPAAEVENPFFEFLADADPARLAGERERDRRFADPEFPRYFGQGITLHFLNIPSVPFHRFFC